MEITRCAHFKIYNSLYLAHYCFYRVTCGTILRLIVVLNFSYPKKTTFAKNIFQMKHKFFFVALLSALVILFACNKKEDFVNTKADNFDVKKIDPQTLPEAKRKVVAEYFDNIKTLAFATNSLERNIVLPARYADLDPDLEARLNPIVVKLNYMDLENEETGQPIAFYNLPIAQRVILLDLLLSSDENSMLDKVLLSSEILDDLKASNDAMKRVFRRHELQVIPVERDLVNVPRDKYHLIIKELENKSITRSNSVALFDEIVNEQPELKDVRPRFFRGAADRYRVDPKKVEYMHRHNGAYMGYILYRRPDLSSTFGHTGIIYNDIPWHVDFKDEFSIDAYPKSSTTKDGVQYMPFDSWCREHNVMGLRYVKRKFKWNWFGSKIVKTYENIDNLTQMANRAKNYIGRIYNSSAAAAKAFAPNRFICSSLVWYCAKESYSIDISDTWKPTVTPLQIKESDHTYTKIAIRK